ncbi:unnamed protein product [Acanthosepion pharaonis]|uniref:EGF-like domain-containing protein n=1 Tax=Acanthosepion pharaonis TaxID=158019 RepID=A0A812B5P5_ACAPH|nr:unnamed protein product [Sepia pharaonis]
MCDLCDEARYINTTGSSSSADCTVSGVCLGSVCQNGGTCHPLHQNFYCECPREYLGLHCETPINPCESQPCFNGQPCIPTLGSFNYTCNCGSPYQGRNCEIGNDFCQQSTICQNHAICKSGPSGYECVCPSWDKYIGTSCDNLRDPCSNIVCENGGVCRNLGNIRHYCDCPDSYKGELCEIYIDLCESSPCLNNGTCVSSTTDIFCYCTAAVVANRSVSMTFFKTQPTVSVQII